MVRLKNEIRCKTVHEELQDMYYKTSAAAEDMTKKSLNVQFFKLRSILFIYVPPYTHIYAQMKPKHFIRLFYGRWTFKI